MPGFFVSNTKVDIALENFQKKNTVYNEIENDSYSIKRNTLDKFLDDKLFFEDDDCIVITEGVFLNKKELCEKYNKNWKDTVKEMIEADGDNYFDDFRGNFCGAHFNKKTENWVFYTDALSMRPVFYYNENGVWMVSSDMNYITDALSKLNASYSFDESSAYDIMTYGFMTSDATLLKEIKKLPYGSYITISKENELKTSQYFDFYYYDDTEHNIIPDDDYLIDKIDDLFRKAVAEEFQKDCEYGYEHLVTLSGGLDSRMTLWVAHKLGFKNIQNLTFGQSDCMDEQVAKKVAKHLQNDIIVKTLDSGSMLTSYKEVVEMNSGLSLYSGIAHTFGAISKINCDNYGLLHTGDVGDAIIGSFAGSNEGKYPGAYSLKLANRIKKPIYNNIEKYKMQTRGFCGVGASKLIPENYIHCFSPFLHRDFFTFCLKEIPKSKRDGHYIYKAWVLKKYPDAAQIPLQRYNNGLMTEGALLQAIRKIRRIGIGTLFEWALWKSGIKKELSRKVIKKSMNPLDTWYEEKPQIKEELTSYFKTITDKLENTNIVSETLKNDMKYLFEIGNTSEKTQVITVLATIDKLFFK